MMDGLITGVVNLGLFGLVVLVRRLVHDERLAAFGLQNDVRSWRLLFGGLAAGTLLFATYAMVAVAFGTGRLLVAWPALADTLGLVASWGFGFAGVALFEEGLFRGYLLSQLRAQFSVTAAITGQAVLFGAFHLMAYQASPHLWLGLLNVGALAIVQAVLVVRTHSLMAAVGFHLAWDLVQTVLLMQHLKGVDTVLNLRITEGLWTGTAFTPETGLIVSLAVMGFGVLLASTNMLKRPVPDAV
jgi:membrane protease YdiL (CAAX protease family)